MKRTPLVGRGSTRLGFVFAMWIALVLMPGAQTPPAICAQQLADQLEVSVSVTDTHAIVNVGQDLFAEYDARLYARPILYPLLAPGQVSLVRHWPMKDDVAGEARDHPHHKSLWFAHGDVNGLDFWSEKARIENFALRVAPQDEGQWPGIAATNHWLDGEKPVCVEEATILFAATSDTRMIDFHYVLSSEQDVKFGDTKEGTFALRTHPALNLTPVAEGGPFGHGENSAGARDKEMWGQPASWLCYYGQVAEQDYGIAVFDHPRNLRHPTTWHARDYGLIAANPFGLHDFLKQPAGSGDYQLPAGESLQLRYRVVLFRGGYDRQQVERWFQQFAETK